jgi:hypothetical protein
MGHRYYDAGTGRFLTRDPKGYGGGINLYGFTGNNPVNEMDPEGLDGSGFSDGSDPSAYFNNLFSYATPRDVIHALVHNDVTRAVKALVNGISYIPLPENPAADAKVAEGVVEGSEIVYRALKDSEIADVAAGKGIVRPDGRTTLTQHLMNANKATTPFISTTRSLESARYFATHGGTRAIANPIIMIDLSKITSKINDVSTLERATQQLNHRQAIGYAIRHKEITIGEQGVGGRIPPGAIVGIIR